MRRLCIGCLSAFVVLGGLASPIATAELTADGRCAPDVAECLHVSTTALAAIYARLRVRVRHGPVRGSPHYGARHLHARWGARRCELSDSREAPVIDADSAIFSAAFSAVLEAIATARSAAGPR